MIGTAIGEGSVEPPRPLRVQDRPLAEAQGAKPPEAPAF